jgi:hypothetical protein
MLGFAQLIARLALSANGALALSHVALGHSAGFVRSSKSQLGRESVALIRLRSGRAKGRRARSRALEENGSRAVSAATAAGPV